MKKKFLGRLLTMLLVAAMVFTLLPASAIAADWWGSADEYADDVSTQAATDVNYKIVHLDCGRKYFSKDWIIALLYEMQNDGYNQLQLAFGNDGLRFLLDDMSFTANGTTYSHDTVVQRVESGNKAQNSSGDARWLTESEMEEIIATAKTLGIEIVPLLNLPGHANAILDIVNDKYNASGSNNTLDVANSAEAREFGKAIFAKYLDYFAGKGCKFFNFGADEYANDASGTFSFSRLNSTQYQAFVSFINDLAGMINEKSMTPRAFNDGLYYNGQKIDQSTYKNIQSIQCCYWSSGWVDYPVASASTIAGNGHEMINTNGDFYYVLGKSDKFDSDYSYARNFTNSGFMGSTISSSVGSMFCIWCDYPNAESETEVAKKARLVLRAMALRMDNQSINSVSDEVIENGFNADGTLNTTKSETGITIVDSATGKVPTTMTTEGMLTLSANKAVTWTADPAGIVNLLDPKNGVSSQTIEVYPVTPGTVTITATDPETETLAASITLTVTDPSAAKNNKTISLTIGGSETVPLNDVYYSESDVDRTNLNTNIATVAIDGKQATSESYNYPEAEAVTLANILNYNTSQWTETKYYYQDNGNYYRLYAKRSDSGYFYYTYTYGYLKTGDSSYTQIDKTDTAGFPSYFPTSLTLYNEPTITPGTPASTTITFTGVAPGTTYVTVGDTKYTIIVDYKQETVNVVLGQTKTVPVEGTLNASGLDTSIAEVTVSGTNMTVAGKKIGDTSVIVGNTKYTIQVREEDLNTVKPLTIEYWITNARVDGSTSGANSVNINAADTGVATEAGVSLTGIVDSAAAKDGRTQEYWQAKMLDVTKENNSTSGTELQTTKNGDDETMSGTVFTKVRYYSGEWQVYTTEWVTVDRTQKTVNYVGDNSTTVTYTGDRNQLVAYFMETVNIANADGKSELKANAADWGTKGDGSSSFGYNPGNDICSVSIQIVYEDNTTNPASTAAADLKSKTIVYGYWSGGRGIGTMLFTGQNYQIYKVTAETGTMKSTTGSGYTVTVTSFDWDKNEETVWEGNAQDRVSIGNPARNPSYEEPYDNLAWNTSDYNKNNAILIRVYVKAPLTKDTLNVHYIDTTNGSENEFYQYSINVFEGTVFDSDFGRTNAGTLVGNTVVNTNNITQTVQWDLSQMPRISAAYRHAAYNFYNATRSTDGKDVYLYYTFSRTASFIADFGLPITISLAQINDTLGSANVTGIKVETQKYGDVTTDVSAKTITYTPTKTFGEDIESLQVTVSGEITVTDENGTSTNKGDVTYTVYILPASNVLYEENFLTPGSEPSSTNVTRHTWSESKFDANKVQQTQKQDEAQIFGKDTAYEGITAAAGYWTVGNLNTSKDGTTSLTTSFFGNALDVIGSCGPNTGRVMITIKDADGKAVQSVLVDTRYSAGSIDQVPLAHIELGDTDANYTAVIRGYARPSTSAQSASSPLRTYSYNSASYDALTADLAAMGLTMADVKVVSASEAAAKVASTQSAARTYALNSTESTGATVTIDGFRVYRSADVEAYSSLSNEYNMTYKNILDVMDGKIITAYVDDETVTDCDVNDYEAKGGPQNEIYLSKNQSVVFQIPGVDSIQVSLRAVNGTAEWNNKEITSNTEMYYTLLSSDTEGNFTIANSSENLLAIGNVKLPAGSSVVKTSALSKDTILASVRMALNAAPVDPEPEQPTVFVPEHFSIRDYATRFFRSKLVTLRIDFSKDVSYVEIDGRKYTPNKLASWFGYYTVTFTDTIGRNDDYFYKVVFFDANGNPSETQIVYGK